VQHWLSKEAANALPAVPDQCVPSRQQALADGTTKSRKGYNYMKTCRERACICGMPPCVHQAFCIPHLAVLHILSCACCCADHAQPTPHRLFQWLTITASKTGPPMYHTSF
jgi:hypothetical protein